MRFNEFNPALEAAKALFVPSILIFAILFLFFWKLFGQKKTEFSSLRYPELNLLIQFLFVVLKNQKSVKI